MRRLVLASLALVLVLGACARGKITPSEWKGLSSGEKVVIVESLRGHEAAREAKGGFGRLHPKSNEYYIEQIDARYNSGDTRTVTEIWEDLVEPKPQPAGQGLPRA